MRNVMDWGNSYTVDRKFAEKFSELLEYAFDWYGHIMDEDVERAYCKLVDTETNCKVKDKDDNEFIDHLHVFDNGIFMINPYYWGNSDDLMDYPNFIYYPTGLEMTWYKYPFRAATMNQNISDDEFNHIIEECKNSLYSFKSKEDLKADYDKREAEAQEYWDKEILPWLEGGCRD